MIKMKQNLTSSQFDESLHEPVKKIFEIKLNRNVKNCKMIQKILKRKKDLRFWKDLRRRKESRSTFFILIIITVDVVASTTHALNQWSRNPDSSIKYQIHLESWILIKIRYEKTHWFIAIIFKRLNFLFKTFYWFIYLYIFIQVTLFKSNWFFIHFIFWQTS